MSEQNEEELSPEEIAYINEMANELVRRIARTCNGFMVEHELDLADPFTKEFIINILQGLASSLDKTRAACSALEKDSVTLTVLPLTPLLR